ncbi:MAG: hypothetical protein LBR73_02940 [Oscillospiraceae bacterium]|jgi:hypothetical protein|nr:hypothetical protein [Oscillospiraceae bacterium]
MLGLTVLGYIADCRMSVSSAAAFLAKAIRPLENLYPALYLRCMPAVGSVIGAAAVGIAEMAQHLFPEGIISFCCIIFVVAEFAESRFKRNAELTNYHDSRVPAEIEKNFKCFFRTNPNLVSSLLFIACAVQAAALYLFPTPLYAVFLVMLLYQVLSVLRGFMLLRTLSDESALLREMHLAFSVVVQRYYRKRNLRSAKCTQAHCKHKDSPETEQPSEDTDNAYWMLREHFLCQCSSCNPHCAFGPSEPSPKSNIPELLKYFIEQTVSTQRQSQAKGEFEVSEEASKTLAELVCLILLENYRAGEWYRVDNADVMRLRNIHIISGWIGRLLQDPFFSLTHEEFTEVASKLLLELLRLKERAQHYDSCMRAGSMRSFPGKHSWHYITERVVYLLHTEQNAEAKLFTAYLDAFRWSLLLAVMAQENWIGSPRCQDYLRAAEKMPDSPLENERLLFVLHCIAAANRQRPPEQIPFTEMQAICRTIERLEKRLGSMEQNLPSHDPAIQLLWVWCAAADFETGEMTAIAMQRIHD